MAKYPVRYLRKMYYNTVHLGAYPNFSATGSVEGMRKIYGEDALLVRCGGFIFNVSSRPEIYWNYAK